MAELKPEQKLSLVAQVKSYPAQFWVANTMEIFERLAWYGWFTVMPVYVTGSVETGGLGFSTETRGNLQAIPPFILYLLPVLTGALADRYGFKKMFIMAYLVMIGSYYALGQFHTVPTFFVAFMFVAIGAAIFKPVVVGTVAKVTDESNSATGFGIFYMMVNIGGFFGPIVAGTVRGNGWEWVFVACSSWAAINLILVLLFYKEPTTEAVSASKRSLGKVLDGLVEVLGNLRFFIAVGIVVIAVMVASLGFEWFTWEYCAIFVPVWLIANGLYDLFLPAGSGLPVAKGGTRRFALLKRMHCSNWRFALFLLIMSGFWTSFNQIFYSMPEYIRDFCDTRPIIAFAETVFGKSDAEDPNVGIASKIATISEMERAVIAHEIESLQTAKAEGTLDSARLEGAARNLLLSKVRLTPAALKAILTGKPTPAEALVAREVNKLIVARKESIGSCMSEDSIVQQFPEEKSRSTHCEQEWQNSSEPLLAKASEDLSAGGVYLLPSTLSEMSGTTDSPDVAYMTDRVIREGRQVNPEFIVNIDAGAIVLFQVLVSFLMGRFHRFTTMIIGMFIASVGIGLSSLAGGAGMVGAGSLIWIVAAGIFIFAFGEMMASPTSQEYVGRIAPSDKKALYMGYYFVAIALGNLFGGILSGHLYGTLARDMQRPDLMWLAFGGIMLMTTFVFILYNKFALPKERADTLTPSS